jgi:hypothetical protein
MFIYVRNTHDLKGSNGVATIPLFWWWEFIIHPNHGFTAASYFSAFLVQALVSVIEFIAWFFYLAGSPDWFGWWSAGIGWWGSVFGMILPWLFAAMQLGFSSENGGLDGNTETEFGYNAVFLLIMNLAMWINGSMMHMFMGPRLVCHIKATEPDRRRKVVKKCPLKKKPGMSNAEYQRRCKALFKAAQARANA